MKQSEQSRMEMEVPEATEISISDGSEDNNSVADEAKEADIEKDASHFSQVAKVIGSMNIMDIVACPCCHQNLDDQFKINEPQRLYQHRESLLTHSDDEEDEEHPSDGVLESGAKYRLKRILAEGWLHKKGSGKDWLGTTSWKVRWSRLVLARVDGFEVDVPVLLIYWHPFTSASTAMALDSAVVLAEDLYRKDWDSHRFVIKHKNGTSRVFSSPKADRDDWVYAISQALLQFEKQKAKLREEHRPLSPPRNEAWKNMYAVEIRSPPTSPPVSPRGAISRPISPLPPVPRLPRRPSDGSQGMALKSHS